MAQGTGEVPVLAILDRDDSALLVMRLSDGARLLADQDKVDQPRWKKRRHLADVLAMLRDE